MVEKDVIRVKAFEESKFDPKNQKYGLFSYPGTLAISKHSYFQEKNSKKNKDGTVDAGPKNFTTCWPKTGKGRDALFSSPEPKPDAYTHLPSYARLEKEKVKKLLKVHDSRWKDTGPSPNAYSSYEHFSPSPRPVPKRSFKEGVETGPKNFLTSPMKKGRASVTPGITFGKHPDFISDPYELRNAKGKIPRIKIAHHDSPFKSTDFGQKTFSKNEDTFGGDFSRKPRREVSYSHTYAKHDYPFKYPGKPGELFEKDIKYMPSPLPKIRRKSPSEAVPWKVTVPARSSPSPSIMSNCKNLRAEFQSLKAF